MNKDFWDQRWLEKQTGWDIGYPSPAIVEYFKKQEIDRNARILIPGCGNAYEAEFLFEHGYKNVWVVDLSEHAIRSFLERCPYFPLNQVFKGDFFELEGEFDFIIEQTFFCAISPENREAYCSKMKDLLATDGRLIGLLFDVPLETGPPFGGDYEEYIERFNRYFSNVQIEKCTNSIEPRAGREFWIELSNSK